MEMFDRLPAIPLFTQDPYFSYWLPADKLNEGNPIHWTGAPKWIKGFINIDGESYRYLFSRGGKRMNQTSLKVTPLRTIATFEAAGVELKVIFTSPLLLSDFDIMSTPISFVDYEIKSLDGKEHDFSVKLHLPSTLCYDGMNYKEVEFDETESGGLKIMKMGRKEQNPLCHCADQITIDWGYLYAAAKEGSLVRETEDISRYIAINYVFKGRAGADPVKSTLLVGYDDIYSISYFGYKAKAWFARNGKTLVQALSEFSSRHDEIIKECDDFDKKLTEEAERKGGEDYRLIICAGYRQAIAAHKLIADEKGNMIFLSKENDSNGCIGTADVSYPSIPLFLKYAPELVNAMCRPIFEFTKMPIWTYDFAPHDVGRYPYVSGQVYASKKKFPNGVIIPDFYKMPSGADVYANESQMPVEESANMIIMLETAITYGASDGLMKENADILSGWVKYLDIYGEDPGDQLCTDDFAGHLARNINLSAKSFIGIECYSRILKRLDKSEEAKKWHDRAVLLANSWTMRASDPEGGSYLTFDKIGWSMKYNLVWDKILKLNLIPDEFYKSEIASYFNHMDKYGIPLDSRLPQTKSDWTVWTATLADDKETFEKIIAPVAKYLRETKSRVPFSDWYDTELGTCFAFIARSVQGGLFMALL